MASRGWICAKPCSVSDPRGMGQAIVEFAIILPLLLLLMIGIVNLGFMINAQLILTNAAWEGARVGATLDVSRGLGDEYIRGAIQGSTTGLSDPERITVSIQPDEDTRAAMEWPLPRGKPLSIQVKYPFEISTPFPLVLVLWAEATSRIEYSNPP